MWTTFVFGWHRPRCSCMLLVLRQTWHCWSILKVWALNHRRPLPQLHKKRIESFWLFICRCKGHVLHCEICASIIINTEEVQAAGSKTAGLNLHWDCFTLYERRNTNEMVTSLSSKLNCDTTHTVVTFGKCSFVLLGFKHVSCVCLSISSFDYRPVQGEHPSACLDRLQPPPSLDQDYVRKCIGRWKCIGYKNAVRAKHSREKNMNS